MYGHLTVCLLGGTAITVIQNRGIRHQIGRLNLVRATYDLRTRILFLPASHFSALGVIAPGPGPFRAVFPLIPYTIPLFFVNDRRTGGIAYGETQARIWDFLDIRFDVDSPCR